MHEKIFSKWKKIYKTGIRVPDYCGRMRSNDKEETG